MREEELYATSSATADIYDAGLILCDPLTRLVAYPSFERHMVAEMARIAPLGVHLAIGDVDDLSEYVSRSNETDPSHFGHLAGNECMTRVGEVTKSWAKGLDPWAFSICATFGGDEVIIAAAGGSPGAFSNAVESLRDGLMRDCPCPLSFAVGGLAPHELPSEEAASVYRRLVAHVDAALFAAKAAARARSARPRGEFTRLPPIAPQAISGAGA